MDDEIDKHLKFSGFTNICVACGKLHVKQPLEDVFWRWHMTDDGRKFLFCRSCFEKLQKE